MAVAPVGKNPLSGSMAMLPVLLGENGPDFVMSLGRMSLPVSWVLGLDAQVVGDKWVLLSVAGTRLTCSGYPPPQWFNFNLRASARDST